MQPHAPARVARWLVQGVARRPMSGSCARRPPPPCAPCAPAAQPPCRARPPSQAHALRVVCCPPPRSQPPPCAPRPPPDPLTCRDLSLGGQVARTVRPASGVLEISQSLEGEPRPDTGAGGPADCGKGNERVARRHARAEFARRRDYEREVAERTARQTPTVPFPAAPYPPITQPEGALAPDGSPASRGGSPRCGPGRRPPPPRLVAVDPAHGCQPSAGFRVDPCAHRPRLLLEVDRSPATEPRHARGGPNRLSKESRSTARNGSADDDARCHNVSTHVPGYAPCRPQTLVERLRSRAANSQKPVGERQVHTSTTPFRAGDQSSPGVGSPGGKAGGASVDPTATISRERSELKEAGRGRLVPPIGGASPLRPLLLGGGRLDVAVPAGAEIVHVTVSLDGTRRQATGPGGRRGCLPPGGTGESAAGRLDSWLSFKEIQKKLTGGRRCGDAPDSRREGGGAKVETGACPEPPRLPTPWKGCCDPRPPSPGQTNPAPPARR